MPAIVLKTPKFDYMILPELAWVKRHPKAGPAPGGLPHLAPWAVKTTLRTHYRSKAASDTETWHLVEHRDLAEAFNGSPVVGVGMADHHDSSDSVRGLKLRTDYRETRSPGACCFGRCRPRGRRADQGLRSASSDLKRSSAYRPGTAPMIAETRQPLTGWRERPPEASETIIKRAAPECKGRDRRFFLARPFAARPFHPPEIGGRSYGLNDWKRRRRPPIWSPSELSPRHQCHP